MLHVVGDSHVSVFMGRDGIAAQWPHREVGPDITVYHVGPHLAWTIADREPLVSEIVGRFCKTTDGLLMVFGEIDARMHLVRRHLEKGTSIEQEAANCADRYMESVTRLQAKHRGIRFSVYGPPANPPWSIDGPYPTVGTCVQRNAATKTFNERCRRLCNEADIPFVTVFHRMMQDNGEPRAECFMDVIHLSPRVMYPLLREELRAAGLLGE
jgi:hypothetical protein